MISTEREDELMRLAMQIVCWTPADRGSALSALESVEAAILAVGQGGQADIAKQILAITPSDPVEAQHVLALAREFLDYSSQRARLRMNSRVASRNGDSAVVEFKRP